MAQRLSVPTCEVNVQGSNAAYVILFCFVTFHFQLNFSFLWSPYVIGPCDFYLLSSFFFFPRLISAAVDRISTILPHMVWP